MIHPFRTDEEHVEPGLQTCEVRMRVQIAERCPNNASLLPAAQGVFQPFEGHPFPALHLAECDGATFNSYNIDLTATGSEVSFEDSVPMVLQVLGGAFFSAYAPGVRGGVPPVR